MASQRGLMPRPSAANVVTYYDQGAIADQAAGGEYPTKVWKEAGRTEREAGDQR
jgi:hypothetical protein